MVGRVADGISRSANVAYVADGVAQMVLAVGTWIVDRSHLMLARSVNSLRRKS